jgi:F-type H+-transporting ATPase subunit alpha
MAVADQVAVLYAATNGYVDRISVDRVAEFNRDLVERLHSSASDTLKKVEEGDWSDEVQKALDEAIAEFAQDFGYDLDEEGQPEDDDADESKASSKDSGDSGDSSDDDSDDEESSKEPVGAGAGEK